MVLLIVTRALSGSGTTRSRIRPLGKNGGPLQGTLGESARAITLCAVRTQLADARAHCIQREYGEDFIEEREFAGFAFFFYYVWRTVRVAKYSTCVVTDMQAILDNPNSQDWQEAFANEVIGGGPVEDCAEMEQLKAAIKKLLEPKVIVS